MRFVHVTDLHIDPDRPKRFDVDTGDNARWALATAEAQSPDLILIGGDIALDEGTSEIYANFAAMSASLSADLLLTPGNHDDRSLFEQAFGRRYALGSNTVLDRVCDVGGYTLLLFDTSSALVTSAQLAWLDAVLYSLADSAGRGACSHQVVVLTHYPILTGFSTYMDRDHSLAHPDETKAVFAAYPTLSVHLLCGHYHTEHQTVSGNLRQYCTPSTYFQIERVPEELTLASTVPAIRVVDLFENTDARSVVLYRT